MIKKHVRGNNRPSRAKDGQGQPRMAKDGQGWPKDGEH